jgi:hypothetical protein
MKLGLALSISINMLRQEAGIRQRRTWTVLRTGRLTSIPGRINNKAALRPSLSCATRAVLTLISARSHGLLAFSSKKSGQDVNIKLGLHAQNDNLKKYDSSIRHTKWPYPGRSAAVR